MSTLGLDYTQIRCCIDQCRINGEGFLIELASASMSPFVCAEYASAESRGGSLGDVLMAERSRRSVSGSRSHAASY